MMVQVLSPGVQNHEHAGDGAEALRVGGDFPQRGGGAAHQQVIQDCGVGQGEAAQLRGQREDNMMILDRQEVLRLAVEPVGAGFYGSIWGPLPYSFSRQPIETYTLVIQS